MKTYRLSKTLLIVLGLFCVVTVSYAWMRRHYSDSEIVSRAELIVIGRIKADSIVYVPHEIKDSAGASWEYHAELLISEVVKGTNTASSMVVSIHYGLTPIFGGCYTNRDGTVIDLRELINFTTGSKTTKTNYPSDIIQVLDTGSTGGGAFVFTGDIRTNHIWLLHHVRPPWHHDSDMIGVLDPEDIQPMAKKAELMSYLK